MVAAGQPRDEVGGQVLATDQVDERVVRRQVRNHHGRSDLGSVA